MPTVVEAVKTKTIALVGAPNVGKSVLFHRLTGRYATVSNYPGTTVDVASGVTWLAGEKWRVVDTPGVNSLLPSSEDERATRDFLLRERPEVIVNVGDAKNLRRSLRLTMELAEYGIPMVLALNLSDEAQDRGIHIDAAGLSKKLGIPVVPTVATTGEGMAALQKALAKPAKPSISPAADSDLERSLTALGQFFANSSGRAVAQALLAGDDSALTWSGRYLRPGVTEKALYEAAVNERARFARPPRHILFDAQERLSARIAAETVSLQGRLGPGLSQRIGQWCLRPWPGFLIAAAVLYAVYQFVGVFGAGTAVDFLENTVFAEYITPWVTRLLGAIGTPQFLMAMLVGEYGVVSMAFSYAFALILPIVATFFIAFGLLEDSGYLPRLSVLLDRVFRLMGLNGRAVLPMVLGLGCDTMATMTTRILDTPKERLIVSLLLSLSVPCSAQLAVILGMTAGISPRVLVIWLLVLVGVTLAAGWGAARILPGARSTFVMEIPPIRRPLLRNILMKMKIRLTWYLKEVVPLFVYGTLILFFLDRWGALKVMERAFAPLVQSFLGLPKEATQAFLIGFLRRDYGAAGLYHLQKDGLLNLRQVTVSLVLITLFMPCVAQWFMTFKERGWKWALMITAAVLVIALGVAGGLNLALAAWPGLLG